MSQRSSSSRRPAPKTGPTAHRRRPGSPNVVAAALLLFGGVAAFASGFATWGSAYGSGIGGLELIEVLQTLAPEDYAPVIGQAITGVVTGGALVILCGCLMLAPFKTHRPVGVVAALVTVLVGAAVIVVMARLGSLFSGGVGSWLFGLSPVACLLGSVAALVRH